jgi:hypothetical protein
MAVAGHVSPDPEARAGVRPGVTRRLHGIVSFPPPAKGKGPGGPRGLLPQGSHGSGSGRRGGTAVRYWIPPDRSRVPGAGRPVSGATTQGLRITIANPG